MGNCTSYALHCFHCMTKETIHGTGFLTISCDEVIMINNQSSVNIHAYLMQSFKHILVLLNLE